MLHDFITQPTFQMKRVLVTRYLNKALRKGGAWMARHETNSSQY